jgi:hypothetical protein
MTISLGCEYFCFVHIKLYYVNESFVLHVFLAIYYVYVYLHSIYVYMYTLVHIRLTAKRSDRNHLHFYGIFDGALENRETRTKR